MALQRWISLRGGPHCIFVLRQIGPIQPGLVATGTLVVDIRAGTDVELISAKTTGGSTTPAVNGQIVRISIFDGEKWEGTSAIAVAATHDRPVIIEVA